MPGPSLRDWRRWALTIMLANGSGVQAADVPLLSTPAWRQPGGLALRTESANGSPKLLLRHVVGAVYRYDAAAATLVPTDEVAWARADGTVAECERQLPAPEIAIDGRSGHASVGGRSLDTAGARAVTSVRSPLGKRALLVSAARRGGSVMPFLGQGDEPPFHHQVVTLPDGRLQGKAVQLPFGGRTKALLACWSADERFAVYADLVMSSVAVVPLPR